MKSTAIGRQAVLVGAGMGGLPAARVLPDITYATAVFAVPEDAPTDWKAVATFDPPTEGGLAAVMFPLEHDRWIVTLVGRHGEKPPGDRDGFLAYAQRLRTPTIYDAIEKAEQLGEIARFGFPASFRRHFDRLVEFPRGLLPFGDSICRFNPVYGQGMSVAAQEARLLHELLERHAAEPDPLAGLAPAFFAESASLIDAVGPGCNARFGAPQDGGTTARGSAAKS
jgi:2-polyprenyl-6-methoxyphenol hydroxylase-like FAD-dependent oxidoreductase